MYHSSVWHQMWEPNCLKKVVGIIITKESSYQLASAASMPILCLSFGSQAILGGKSLPWSPCLFRSMCHSFPPLFVFMLFTIIIGICVWQLYTMCLTNIYQGIMTISDKFCIVSPWAHSSKKWLMIKWMSELHGLLFYLNSSHLLPKYICVFFQCKINVYSLDIKNILSATIYISSLLSHQRDYKMSFLKATYKTMGTMSPSCSVFIGNVMSHKLQTMKITKLLQWWVGTKNNPLMVWATRTSSLHFLRHQLSSLYLWVQKICQKPESELLSWWHSELVFKNSLKNYWSTILSVS